VTRRSPRRWTSRRSNPGHRIQTRPSDHEDQLFFRQRPQIAHPAPEPVLGLLRRAENRAALRDATARSPPCGLALSRGGAGGRVRQEGVWRKRECSIQSRGEPKKRFKFRYFPLFRGRNCAPCRTSTCAFCDTLAASNPGRNKDRETDARNATQLRAVRPRSAAGNGRRADLLVRMYVLRAVH
jgi:hypothetical protein